MSTYRIAAASVNQTPLDWAGNRRRIEERFEQAREVKAGLVVLPELCISAYGCEDLFLRRDFCQSAMQSLFELLPASHDLMAIVGLPVEHAGKVFNCAAVIQNGDLLGFVPKQKLCGDGLHYEPRWFAAWPAGVQDQLEVRGRMVVFGDYTFQAGELRLGIEICEDSWSGLRPAAGHVRDGVNLIANPAASHFAFGKDQVRRNLVLESSRNWFCHFVYANLTGNESGRVVFDGDLMIASNGRMLTEARRFCQNGGQMVWADIDLEEGLRNARRTFHHMPRLPLARAFQAASLPHVSGTPAKSKPSRGYFEQYYQQVSDPFGLKALDFVRAESAALFDYMRKSHSRGFVLSLSGGADSALCAFLCREALCSALYELGSEAFFEQSGLPATGGHCEALTPGEAFENLSREICSAYIKTAYQGTVNSSQATFDSARHLAENLGLSFTSWNIDEEVASITAKLEKALARRFSWQSDDITLQNIQARVRSPFIWMLANDTRGLLIATSNRSEAALGYATMDGDTSGGISPVAGVDKHFIRRFLVWMEEVQGEKAFAPVNRLQPSAELRPGEGQTDEEDLMPYRLISRLETLALFEGNSPQRCHEILLNDAALHAVAGRLKEYIDRFFHLWSINQWKRERYALSFHLDDGNLDPRSWLRFPVLNAGFEKLSDGETTPAEG